MDLIQRFGPSLDAAGCAFLADLGSGMTTAGVGLIASGAGFKPGAVTLAGGALATYAARIACPYDQGGKGPEGGEYCNIDMGNVCKKFDVGLGRLEYYYGSFGWFGVGGSNYNELLSIGCTIRLGEKDSEGYIADNRLVTLRLDGDVIEAERLFRRLPNQGIQLRSVSLNQDDGSPSECEAKPFPEPWEGKDGNDCDITVQMMGMGAGPSGDIAPVLLIEPGHQKAEWEAQGGQNRPNPGVISNQSGGGYNQTCSFAPVLAWPQPDTDPVFTPIDPGEDLGDALDRLSKQVNEKFDDVSDDLQDLSDKIDQLLENDDDPTDPEDPLNIPSGTINFQAKCDYDENGALELVQYPLLGATTRNQALTAIYQQNTVIAAMLQQHLNWKTPTCHERPEIRGDWVTVRFESTAASPSSNRPLRKLFRYRSESGRDLGTTTEYWKNFQFSAGPVCVIHKGAWWGVPQVWASSADEGKRVIRHAAGEAGLDPDQVGGWTISGSNNPRYGMPGEMSVAEIDFGPWVTKRDGPNGMPELAVDP